MKHFSKSPKILQVIFIFTLINGYVPTLFGASMFEQPRLSVLITTNLGFDTFSVPGDKNLTLSGNVEWPSGNNPFQINSSIGGSDIYFGLLSPERDKTWTFTLDNDQIKLNNGFIAIAQDSTAGEFNTGEFTHTFSGEEPRGMYMVFLLLVNPGGNPGDIYQWQHIATQPFFFLEK